MRGTASSGSRHRSLIEMLVFVLLVAALAGQPAWGDAGKGKRGHDGQRSATSTKAKPKSSSARNRKSKARAPARPAKRTSARRKKPRQAPAGNPQVAAGEATPDPTPAPANDPAPVDVPGAQPEQGAETLAPPAMPAGMRGAAPPAPAQPESSARMSADEPSSRQAVGSAALAPNETPDASSAIAPPTRVTAAPAVDGSLSPAGEDDTGTVGERPSGADDGRRPTGDLRNAPDAQGDRSTADLAAFGPQPTGNPIQDGPVLQAPARELTQAQTARRTSPSRNGRTSAAGRVSEPSDLGLTQVANLVKDIPAQIKLALAGLAALVVLLGAYTILAAARTRRLERQRAKLMEDIGLLQAALLPAVPGRLGALLTTVAYRPADGPAAGGDFYDAFALSDGRVGLLLGDISGHGRQALAKTTLVRFTVRAHLEAGLSPREALSISGRSLDGRLSDDFSTVIAAIHDPVKGTLTYASAGHPTPLVVGPQAHEPVTASSAPPIGAGFPTGQRQTVLPMPDGSTVAIYSDGLLEARIDGELLGRERLEQWLAELGSGATAKALLELVVERADRVKDDLAAIVLHAAPGASAPAARVEQLKLDVLDVEGPELEGFLKASGVSRADRAIARRRVTELLAVSGGVVVEVRIGEHPMVSVASIGDHASGAARPSSRTR